MGILLACGTAAAQTTTRANVDSSGNQANASPPYLSYHLPRASDDGRFVVFQSPASNLVAGDTNGVMDVFVRDRQLGTTTRVSLSSTGAEPNGACSQGADISASGRYVAFHSSATNLVPGDTNGFGDIFVRDRQAGTTTRVSVTSTGGQLNAECFGAQIAGPSYSTPLFSVAFVSLASNAVAGDTNNTFDAFLYQQGAGGSALYCLSEASPGVCGNGGATAVSLSTVGSRAVFSSSSTNLVANDTNARVDIFLWISGTLSRVSVSSAGAQADGDSSQPWISGDGRFVAFASVATNLVSGDTNGKKDVFVRDLNLGTTRRISVTSAGLQIAADSNVPRIGYDGRFVLFQCAANAVVPGDVNNLNDVFAFDQATGQVSIASLAYDGAFANQASTPGDVSCDGRAIVFESSASNLVPSDTSGADVFVRELPAPAAPTTPCTTRESVGPYATPAVLDCGLPSISSDGDWLTFITWEPSLLPGVNDFHQNAYLRRRSTGATSIASVLPSGAFALEAFRSSLSGDATALAFEAKEAAGLNTRIFVRDLVNATTDVASAALGGGLENGGSFGPALPSDGRCVAFMSYASDLVPGDTNNCVDVFVRERATSVTQRLSVSSAGVQGNAASGSGAGAFVESSRVALDADGSRAAFASLASNLAGLDGNGTWDVFLRDRTAGQTTLVSAALTGLAGNGASGQPAISADGRHVAFTTWASDLVPFDLNGCSDVVVRDVITGTTERVSVDSSGVAGNLESNNPSISADGRFIAFFSKSTNLVAGDTNGDWDVFLRDRVAGTTTRVSVDSAGGQASPGPLSAYPMIATALSADGQRVAFAGGWENLVAWDVNNALDIFVRDLGPTPPVSYCTAGTTSHGCTPAISAVGVASASAASGFTIAVAGIESQQSGILFYGVTGALSDPWGTGTSYLCVKAPLERCGVQASGGVGTCTGLLSVDWNQYVATHPSAVGTPAAAGMSVWAQGWFRDPPAPKTTSLSDGLLFVVQP